MATAAHLKTALTAAQRPSDEASLKQSDPVKIDITRLPTDEVEVEDLAPGNAGPSRTVLHIYFEQACGHKIVTPNISPSQERRWGPSAKQQKARRLAQKEEKKLRDSDQVPPPEPTNTDADASYFLHTPYLSFHFPPLVLYTGSSRYAPAVPKALVHTGWFWRTYKIQLGPSLSQPGVLDPRGVVSWRHNGGSKAELERDDDNDDESNRGRLLKGYKVRGWRLWGESGKRYVHGIRDRRAAGDAFDDPDVESLGVGEKPTPKARADEVVYLTWSKPLSWQTRCYAFRFRGVEFQWKGTATVSEGRTCGWLLRFCHLKLVARIPIGVHTEKGDGMRDVCLGKYTSSIAAEKSGTLTIFDEAVLRVVQERVPSLLEESLGEEDGHDFDEQLQIAKLKRGVLYQLFVTTALCMAAAEKEKRHTLIDFIIGAGENAGNGGG